MKISYRTDYSLKAILVLAKHYPDRLVHLDELSGRQDIPRKYLEQLLLSLKKGGFVQSKKGPRGGIHKVNHVCTALKRFKSLPCPDLLVD